MARHRAGCPAWRLIAARRRTIEMVDACTLKTHHLTDAAEAAGRRGRGRYYAVCGVEVRPASLTVPGRGWCPACTATVGAR